MNRHDIVHKLYTPLFGWIFMIVWMSLLGLAIHNVMKDGLPGQMDSQIEVAIFGLFIFFGIFATMTVFYEPLVFLKVKVGNITIKQVWLFQTRTYKGGLSDCPEITFVIDKDSDGDVHYQAIIKMENQEEICFLQSYNKDKAEKAVVELNERIAKYKG